MIKYICAQPNDLYFVWQIEILINNFIKNGINPKNITILIGVNKSVPQWHLLVIDYPEVNFHFYPDTRKDKSYIPSIYFHLMAKHLKAFPELKDDIMFLHDSDIIFTKPPDLNWVKKSKIWYMSNTNSYINYDYILSKGETVYLDMCKIMNIDPLIPKLMNDHSGGAQYIINGEDYKFWEKVEVDSNKLYKHFCETEKNYKGNGYPIQKWTAGMWSLLWNAWIAGHPTEVRKELDFCWSTDNIERSQNNFILHNAGVKSSDSKLFYKGKYINRLPFDDEIEIDQTKCSSIYYKELKQVQKITKLQ